MLEKRVKMSKKFWRNTSWCSTGRLSASSSCRSEPECVAQKQPKRSQQMEVKECLKLEITRELAISGFYGVPAQVASTRNAAVKNVSVRSEDEPIKERSPSSGSSYLSHTWFGLIRNPKRVFIWTETNKIAQHITSGSFHALPLQRFLF